MKVTAFLTLLGATAVVAAPAFEPDHHKKPHEPSPTYGWAPPSYPTQSVGWKPWKRAMAEPDHHHHQPTAPAYPTQSVGWQPWKRHVERDADADAFENWGKPHGKHHPSPTEPWGPPSYPTQSVGYTPWKRAIQHPAADGPEVLTA